MKLELEKWIFKFDEKLSSLQKELQNEKNANQELKKHWDEKHNTFRKEVEVMLNEKSEEFGAKIETLSTKMATEHDSLRNEFTKLVTEKMGKMEISLCSKMDSKDLLVKKNIETMFNEKHC